MGQVLVLGLISGGIYALFALGVAGIDLIYLRLSTILCAADRVMPRDSQIRLSWMCAPDSTSLYG